MARDAPPLARDDMAALEHVTVNEVEVSRFNPNRHRDDWETLERFAAGGDDGGNGEDV